MVVVALGRMPKIEQKRIEQASLSLVGKPPRGFEWIDQLSHAHQRQFAVEFYRAMAGLTINYNPRAILELLDSWQATAAVDADAELVEHLRRPKEEKDYVDWRPQR